VYGGLLAHFPLCAEAMEPAIYMEELLKPEAILPVQFSDIWNGSRKTTPERALVVVVLWQAADDLQKYRFARGRKQQRLYMEAYHWVASDDCSWPYSFVNLCEALNLSPEHLRAELLSARTPSHRFRSSEVAPQTWEQAA
jgi:hypothetical protein